MRRALGALALGLLLPAAAQEPLAAGGMDLQLTRDTDGFEASRLRAMGLWRRDNPWSHQGVAVQTTRYSDGAYRQRAQGVLFVHRDQRRDTLAGVQVEAGAVRIGGKLRAIGEATLRLATRLDMPSYEVVLAADLVETPLALERAIAYGLAGAGVEVPWTPRFTTTAFAAWQDFTDGNARAHLRGRLIWMADESRGITLQLRYRGYRSREEDVGGAYFNPSRYHQGLAVAAMRRRHGYWTYQGELGAGRERVDGTSRPSYLAEVRAEGPLAGDVRLLLRAGYSRSTGFMDSPDYAYRYVGVNIVAPLE